MVETDISSLRDRWTHLYATHLPVLAKARDPVQPNWPVYLDHCFARIILDNAVGVDKPWTEVVKAPAVKNMSATQLEKAIELGERLATGRANLVELDERSLGLRGKKGKVAKVGKRKRDADGVDEVARQKSPGVKKVKKEDGDVSKYFLPSPERQKDSGKTRPGTNSDLDSGDSKISAVKKEAAEEVDMEVQLKRIQDSNLTSFRKKCLTMLCQIPRGRYTTYQAMANYITQTSHMTCARAVGSAMRNNPFAPEVPCHRVVAHDGTLGGFKGAWGKDGQFADEKMKLLYEEGVKFSSAGKVYGPAFRDFKA